MGKESSGAASAGVSPAFQRLCIAASAVVLGLIVLGGVVRATDSGLGCPDWPRCHGSFIPKWEKHTLIEYAHRLTASVAGVLVFAALVFAWRAYRRLPAVLYPATLAAALIIFQAWLGRETVVRELPEEVVTLHLGVALVTFSVLVTLAAAALALGGGQEPPLVAPEATLGAGFGRLALLAAALTFVLALVGAYVAGADYGLACSGWPLCNGEVVPSGGVSVQVVFGHRVLALLLGVIIAALALVGWRARAAAPAEAYLAGGALAVYVLQVLVGAVNIWTRLADAASAGHLALATLLWLLLLVLNLRVHRLHLRLPAGRQAEGAGRLAGATQ